MPVKTFTNRKHFPGTVTSQFDFIVRFADNVERIPAYVLAPLLFLVALLPTRGDWLLIFSLWLFMLGDWVLLALLPRFGKSFGPAKPPVLLLAALRVPLALLPLPLSFILEAFGTLLVVYGFWIEPHRLTLTRQQLVSDKLAASPPLRIMHLGDLYIERVTDRERQLVEMVKAEKPDLILFSGDFLNLSNVDDPVAWEHARSILCNISAPLGVYAVSGSPPVDKPEVVSHLLEGTPIRWLQDEKVRIDYKGHFVDVVGLTCTHNPDEDAPRLAQILDDGPDPFTILVYHTPDLAPNAAEMGVDLQLSGHTHGGQVCLPFWGALYTASLYGKRFEAGRRQVDKLTLYVTRGIGLEGQGAPRVRFLCPPEVIMWEIRGHNSNPMNPVD